MNIIEEGKIEGEFKGFKDNETIFKFLGGQSWKQDEFKLIIYYEYMPNAKIIEEFGAYYLEIPSMNNRVKVKKL